MTTFSFSRTIWNALCGLWKSMYARYFGIFVALQLFFLYEVNHRMSWGKSQTDFDVGDSQTAFLICSVHFLVMVNTITFFAESFPVISKVRAYIGDDDTQPHVKQVKDAFICSMVFSLLSIFCCGAVSLLVGLTWAGIVGHRNWNSIIEISEYVSGLLFLYFVFGDLCSWEVIKRAQLVSLSPACITSDELSKTLKRLKLYICAVDCPGMIGIWLIILCGHFLYPAAVQALYWQGFVAGAIGLHIMFSQGTLAFLSLYEIN